MAQYNCAMADRIACSCVTCPKCGTWGVVGQRTEIGEAKMRESCPVPECGKEFEFESGETRVFEVPLLLFERRRFDRSEWRCSPRRRAECRCVYAPSSLWLS